MKKLLSLSLVAVMLAVLFIGCGHEKKDANAKYVYYLATDRMSIVPIEYTYKADDLEGMFKEALAELSKETQEVDYIRTIPAGIQIEDASIDSGMLSIYFDRGYSDLDTYSEILIRAAIVKTVLQIDGIDAVSFYVSNNPLVDKNETAVGIMTADTFVETASLSSASSLEKANLKLYFASADGQSIVCEERSVNYSPGVPREKVILDELLKGPEVDTLQRAIMPGTKVLSITNTDGTCYVNFDSTFLTNVSGISELATVYSIVDSLTSIEGIVDVQILVNGKTASLASVDISSPLTYNEEIISSLLGGAKAGISEVME